MKKLFSFALIFFLILSYGCYNAHTVKKDDILAEVGDIKITREEVDLIINFYAEEQRESIKSNKGSMAALVKDALMNKLIAKRAREVDFDKSEKIIRQLELKNDEFLRHFYMRDVYFKGINLSDVGVKKYYERHKDEYAIPEKIRARHILIKFSSHDDKSELKKKAVKLLEKIKEGADFSLLARQNSDDKASKNRGGDLGFFTKGAMDPEFEKATFSLKPGDISDIVETKYGYHIIKLEERKERQYFPFEKIKEQVRIEAITAEKNEKLNELMVTLYTDAGGKIYFDRLVKKKAEESKE